MHKIAFHQGRDAMFQGCIKMAVWLLAMVPLALSTAHADTIGRCGFDRAALQFHGAPEAQAACLLRHVAKWGKVDAAPATLPPEAAALIGTSVGALKAPLRSHLAAHAMSEASLGGSLDQGLSRAHGGAASAPMARYFVIHDTSAPWLGNATGFPPDTASELNELTRYAGPNAAAHVFVNRQGETLSGHDLSVPWRATKLEVQQIGLPAKGLFIHIELLQPRRRDPAGGAQNDAIAPSPGFTAAQYDKLALLYVAASVRAGQWLIPAFHAAIDEGLSDGHDDPQHFELALFTQAVATWRQRLAVPGEGPAAPPAPVASSPVEGAPPSRAEACTAIVAGLAMLKDGQPLMASHSGGKTWQRLYDDCDATDTFAGQALPLHAGKRLRCSNDPNRVAMVSKYPGGTILFKAKMSVDADGSPVIGGSGWPNNVQTWLTFDPGSAGHFVNAEEVPFIVVPLAVPGMQISFRQDTGIGKGDLAVVVRGGQCSFGVVGDAGPWFRLGEASLRTHADLGNPQCLVPGQHPCQKLRGGSGVGLPSGVSYLVFPGTRPQPLLSQTVNAVAEAQAARLAVDFMRANSR